jgi:hypothetical protein
MWKTQVESIVAKVKAGKAGFLALHSAHVQILKH